MKSTQFFVVLVVALVMSSTPSSACSNLTVKGSYGFLLTGVKSSKLAAILGQVTADGIGGLTGSETISSNGVISSNVAIAGSYSIKSNCTGTAKITPSGFPADNYNLTIVSTGKQIEMVDTDTGTAESGYAFARGTSACTDLAVKGTLGFHGGGFTSSLVPSNFAGQAKLDGLGKLIGTETAGSGGKVVSGTISGTYTVNSDCTGSVSVSFLGSTSHDNFVIVNGDNSALYISTDTGKIVTTTATKQ